MKVECKTHNQEYFATRRGFFTLKGLKAAKAFVVE